ncbi:hypothetical protein LTR85_004852 [Meristemomyces frigidus]|nr:hypothetical protein LTR85_004852 [Meristemomyces frigidus]
MPDYTSLAYLLSNGLNISLPPHSESRASSTRTLRAPDMQVELDEKKKKKQSLVEGLPTELLADIFQLLHFHSPSIHAIRLTCSGFHDSAWKAFGHTFNRKFFHLSKTSLDGLAALTEEEGAVAYITQLNVSTVCLQAAQRSGMLWSTFGRDAAEIKRRRAAYQRHAKLAAGDVTFELNGGLRARLEEVLKGLVRLERIVVVDGAAL